MHVIRAIFSSCENGTFLLVEATVCCRFYYWSEIEVIRTKIILQSAYISAICVIAIEVEWAWLRWFNALRSWVLLLSCDYVLKYDWYCQLSGSGSNSLNSWKLPDRFSYGLGTRLDQTLIAKQGRVEQPWVCGWICYVPRAVAQCKVTCSN